MVVPSSKFLIFSSKRKEWLKIWDQVEVVEWLDHFSLILFLETFIFHVMVMEMLFRHSSMKESSVIIVDNSGDLHKAIDLSHKINYMVFGEFEEEDGIYKHINTFKGFESKKEIG